MPRMELPPTKSSLRRLKDDLSFAYEGYDLLNQKREILAMEIMRKIAVIRKTEADFQQSLESLYTSYRNAAVDMGAETIVMQSALEARGYFLGMEITSFMGLKLPEIKIDIKNPRPHELAQKTAAYDEAREGSQKVLQALARYATVTKSVIMLSRELKKVQRRVNALEKIFIPQHEEAKKYITDRIEEMEREEIFVKKLIRQRRQPESGKSV